MNNRYRFFLFTVGFFALLTAAFYGFTYLQTGNRLVLVVPVITAALVVLVPPILILLRLGRTTAAGVLLLLGLSLAYASNELVWQGMTIFNLIGGILLIVLTGNFVLQRRYVIWFVFSLLYAGLILAINVFTILPVARYDISNFPFIFPFSLGSNLLLGLAILAQVTVEFQARSIRTRLLATFVLLVFLPVTTIGALTSLINASNAQQRVINQLESVVTLKAGEIEAWSSNLEVEFTHYYPTDADLPRFAALFAQAPGEAVDPVFTQVVDRLTREMQVSGLFSEIFFLTPQGRIVLSTQPNRAGLEQGNAPFFQPALKSVFRSALYYSPTANQDVVILAGPVKDAGGALIGMVAGRANLAELKSLMGIRSGLGETGETFLVTSAQTLLNTSLLYPDFVQGQTILLPPMRYLIQTAVDPGMTIKGSGQYISYHQLPVLGYYRWMAGLDLALFAEQQQAEALATTYQSLLYTVILSVISVVIAFLVGLYAVRRISQPLGELAQTAQEIASGNLGLKASDALVAGLDEIGALARAFNSMTGQLRSLVGDLEQRVEQRTLDLENRSHQLQLAAETARDASSLRDLDELVKRAVLLVCERFGFSHAAIYLFDERGEVAILAASSNPLTAIEPSRRQFERLQIGREKRVEQGEAFVIAEAARLGAAYVSRPSQGLQPQNVSPKSVVRVGMPLRAAGKMIGVLLLESDEFDQSLTPVLQIVADQLAISIDSARLLRQTQETVRELQILYGSYTSSAWQREVERLGERVRYRSRGFEAEPVSGSVGEQAGEEPGDEADYSVPLRLRGQQIGSLHFRFDGQSPSPEVLAVYTEMANRLSLLLENARLLHEAQSQVAKEQQINQISSQVRSSINLEAILRNTVRELGAAFGASRTFIQITPAFSETGQGTESSQNPPSAGMPDRVGPAAGNGGTKA